MRNIYQCLTLLALLIHCKNETSKDLQQDGMRHTDYTLENSQVRDTFPNSINKHQNTVDCGEVNADSLFYLSKTLERRKIRYTEMKQNLEHSSFSIIMNFELNNFFKRHPFDIIEEEIDFDLPESIGWYQKLLKIDTKTLQDINTEVVYSTNINGQSKNLSCSLAMLGLPDTLGINYDFILFKYLQGSTPVHSLHVFKKHVYGVPWRVYSVRNSNDGHIIILTFYTPGSTGSMLTYDDLLIYNVNSNNVIYNSLVD
ncbi:MAG: hypothetical protein H6574_14505 [Lewinellaceae bacterium]|nr:hypothetical protein [Lewinellaceae bacterium]